MKRNTFYILFIYFLSINYINAQDIHFSQFFNSPLNLNPALTGGFNGDYRFVGNQRTQWKSVTTPYNTFGLSAEMKGVLNHPNLNLGLTLYSDKAGDSEFGTLQVGPSISYTVNLKDSVHFLTYGVHSAFTQRTINYNNLTFDNQYNGISYDPNAGNGELFANNGKNYINIHSGVSYQYNIALRKSITTGIALHNVNQPKQTFFSDNTVKLKQRLTLHAELSYMVHDKIDVIPRIQYQRQHKFREFIFGGAGKYYLNKGDYKAFYLGLWYRNKDATYLSAELDWRDFHFGISYDFNLSTLKTASNNKGGFEFSVIYIIKRFKPVIKKYKACPNYI